MSAWLEDNSVRGQVRFWGRQSLYAAYNTWRLWFCVTEYGLPVRVLP